MKDVLRLVRQIKACIKSCDITERFIPDAIHRAGAWLESPGAEELEEGIGWVELVDLHVLAYIFDNRDMEFETVRRFRSMFRRYRFPHDIIDYIYDRTAIGSALQEAVVEEMSVRRLPLDKDISYPQKFLFDLAEAYRKLWLDRDEEESESDDDSDDGVSHIVLKNKLSWLLDILQEEDEDENINDEDEDIKEGEDEDINVQEDEDEEIDIDCGVDEVRKEILLLMVQVVLP